MKIEAMTGKLKLIDMQMFFLTLLALVGLQDHLCMYHCREYRPPIPLLLTQPLVIPQQQVSRVTCTNNIQIHVHILR